MVQTVKVLSTAHVAWALLHPVETAKIIRGVSWPGAQAILSWAAYTGMPAGASATIDWGDGSGSSTVPVPPPALVAAFSGLARGYDDVDLATGHTYSVAGSYHLTVTVNAPGHSPISTEDYVQVDPSVPTFTVSPSVPHAGIPGSPAEPAMLEPDPQSPTGSPVTEYDWNFGDGTGFKDTPAVEAAWVALLNRPDSHSPGQAFEVDALKLGIDVTLGGHVDPTFGVVLWAALPAHIVPHVFSIAQGYRISLTEKTASGSATGSQDIATQTTCHLWASGLFGDYTVCDTAKGWDVVTSSPNRWPDYYTFLLSLGGNSKAVVFGANIGLTIASTGDVYVSYGVNGGLGLSLPGGGSGQVAFGMGFIEAPDGPKPDPSVITNYVDGWTVNAAWTATLGALGGSEAIVWSPTSNLGGEEYYITGQKSFSLSLTVGGSCNMHVGNVSQANLSAFASLVPSSSGPWPWQAGVTPPTVSPKLISQLLNLIPPPDQLRTCGVGPPIPPS